MKWQAINQQFEPKNGTKQSTEAMQLPHGCLMRTTIVQGTWWGGRSVATATAFVPGGRVTEDGKIEHRL